MLVTLSGKLVNARFVQLANALFPMLVIPSGKLVNARLVQPEKAALPMLVTVGEIFNVDICVFLRNARSPIVVTPIGKLNSSPLRSIKFWSRHKKVHLKRILKKS